MSYKTGLKAKRKKLYDVESTTALIKRPELTKLNTDALPRCLIERAP